MVVLCVCVWVFVCVCVCVGHCIARATTSAQLYTTFVLCRDCIGFISRARAVVGVVEEEEEEEGEEDEEEVCSIADQKMGA